VTDYSFDNPGNPCTNLTCGDSSIYESISYTGSKLEVDVGDSISLANVTLKNLSASSTDFNRVLTPDKRLSPREVVGSGSQERKLFDGRATLDTSGLSSGTYGLYIWTCKDRKAVGECDWRPYNFTVS